MTAMIEADKEYGQALFMLAAEEDQVEPFYEELCLLKETALQPDYLSLLDSPAIPLSERLAAIDEAFGALSQHVVSFLKLLCENGRIRQLAGAIEEYGSLRMAMSNRAAAVVSSAVPLSEDQKAALCAKLSAKLGKQIDASYVVDPSLIGGVKIETQGSTYDGTVKHRLREVKDVIIG